MKTILITGGCGFIGSNYIRTVLDREEDLHVVNLDKLTYAGNIQNLDGISSNNLSIVKGDICDVDLVNSLFEKHFGKIFIYTTWLYSINGNCDKKRD